VSIHDVSYPLIQSGHIFIFGLNAQNHRGKDWHGINDTHCSSLNGKKEASWPPVSFFPSRASCSAPCKHRCKQERRLECRMTCCNVCVKVPTTGHVRVFSLSSFCRLALSRPACQSLSSDCGGEGWVLFCIVSVTPVSARRAQMQWAFNYWLCSFECWWCLHNVQTHKTEERQGLLLATPNPNAEMPDVSLLA